MTKKKANKKSFQTRVVVYCSPAQKHKICTAAERAGIGASAYVIRKLFAEVTE